VRDDPTTGHLISKYLTDENDTTSRRACEADERAQKVTTLCIRYWSQNQHACQRGYKRLDRK